MARSKEFDIDEVLEKAMHLFWQQGYEKTSMQDLVAGMGIHKRSMYDTFGDKHTLYMRAVRRYALEVLEQLKQRSGSQPSVKLAIRSFFEIAIRGSEEHPKGCLMVNTAVELSLLDEEARALVDESFKDSEVLLEALVRGGQRSGEITSRQDAAALASYLHNALVGLRVMVKTGQDPAKLEQIADLTLAALD